MTQRQYLVRLELGLFAVVHSLNAFIIYILWYFILGGRMNVRMLRYPL